MNWFFFVFCFRRDCGLLEEDAKTIRGSLLSLVKYYIVKDITLDELLQLFNFMLTCNEESMVRYNDRINCPVLVNQVLLIG